MLDIDPDAIGRSPQDYSWLQYIGIVGLAAWGGIVNYLRKVKQQGLSFDLKECTAEVITSALAGVLTFWTCELFGVPPLMTGVACAIAGHSAARTIALFDSFYRQKLGVPEQPQADPSAPPKP